MPAARRRLGATGATGRRMHGKCHDWPESATVCRSTGGNQASESVASIVVGRDADGSRCRSGHEGGRAARRLGVDSEGHVVDDGTCGRSSGGVAEAFRIGGRAVDAEPPAGGKTAGGSSIVPVHRPGGG